jgi:hypothetical protein
MELLKLSEFRLDLSLIKHFKRTSILLSKTYRLLPFVHMPMDVLVALILLGEHIEWIWVAEKRS